MRHGNFLLLSSTINSSLQNYTYAVKEESKLNRDGSKFRNALTDDSHSEIEGNRNEDWGLDKIRERGIRLVKFMEKCWKTRFTDDHAQEKLSLIDIVDGKEPDVEISE